MRRDRRVWGRVDGATRFGLGCPDKHDPHQVRQLLRSMKNVIEAQRQRGNWFYSFPKRRVDGSRLFIRWTMRGAD